VRPPSLHPDITLVALKARMRPDLLEEWASIDWPFSLYRSFEARLQQWLESNISIEVRETPPPAEYNAIVAVEKTLLPLTFSVEAGAYINAIRSSLDILAMALVRRHRLPISEIKVCFPIFHSEAEFRKKEGGLLLRHLPERERTFIEKLVPYREGNPDLWMLHHLDVIRKHRRLLDVRIQPIHIHMTGALKEGDFKPLATGTIQVNEETVLGLLRKGVPQPALRSSFYIAISEGEGERWRMPVGAVIERFMFVASAIIAEFDR
jgi:hypothetical protein